MAYRIFYLIINMYALKNVREVSGKRDTLPRFIMEDALKPPIFGSYSYDPVKQVFEIEQIHINETNHFHHSNNTYYSTKELSINRNRPIGAHSRIFRKHVSLSTRATSAGKSVTQTNILKWWTKRNSIIRNDTTY